MAKFLNLWLGHPDIVSRGAQKNFANFALAIGKAWTKNPDQFNKRYYTDAIAKAIVFRETEKLVTEQAWYEGGYRANVVAYAIAKIAHDVGEMNLAVDFGSIWRKQGISNALRDALTLAAKASHDVLVTPPAGIRLKLFDKGVAGIIASNGPRAVIDMSTFGRQRSRTSRS